MTNNILVVLKNRLQNHPVDYLIAHKKEEGVSIRAGIQGSYFSINTNESNHTIKLRDCKMTQNFDSAELALNSFVSSLELQYGVFSFHWFLSTLVRLNAFCNDFVFDYDTNCNNLEFKDQVGRKFGVKIYSNEEGVHYRVETEDKYKEFVKDLLEKVSYNCGIIEFV